MAAPADVNILNISGQWVMNQSLSESFDEILATQGVSWFTRTALTHSKLTLKIKHYKDSENVERVEIKQNVAGIRGSQEIRILDWTERERHDSTFGDVIGKSKRSKVADLEHDYLKAGWSEDTVQYGVVYSHARSDTSKTSMKWVTDQTWGFSNVKVADRDERRYVRRVHFTDKQSDKVLQARLVYDYVGPLS